MRTSKGKRPAGRGPKSIRGAALAWALALSAIAAAPAQARVDVSSLSVTPSAPQAASHPDLTIAMSFAPTPSSDDVRNLTITLPPGLVGNPQAVPTCSEASFTGAGCDPATQVGTTTASATVDMLGMPTSLAGQVYNLKPQGDEPARLGVIIRASGPSAVITSPVRLEVPITLRPDLGYALQNRISDIPRTATVLGTSQGITLTQMSMTLNGVIGGRPFMIMPSSCAGGTVRVDAVSYDQPSVTTTRSAPVTPTGCDRVPFHPTVTGQIVAPAKLSDGVPVTVTIGLPAGDSTLRQARVVLPSVLTPNLAAVSRACPEARAAAGTCPDTSRIGTARVTTPLLPVPLVAPVYLVERAGGGLPRIAVPLLGGVLYGDTGLSAAGIVNTFDGLPDVPLTSFALSIDGGPDGLLQQGAPLCAPGTATDATATLLAHAGATATLHPRLALTGCKAGPAGTPGPSTTTTTTTKGKPHGTGSMTVRHGIALLRLTVSVPSSAPSLRRLVLPLPRTLRGGRGRVVARFAGRSRSRRVAPGARSATVSLTGTVRTVGVSWSGLRPQGSLLRALRRHGRAKLIVTVRVRDARGRTSTLRIPLTVRGR